MHRSHHCAQITTADLGATVSLLGWVDTIRDQGGIIFVDLRDRKGVTQIQLEAHDNAKLAEQLKHLKPESVTPMTDSGFRCFSCSARSRSTRVRSKSTTFPIRRRS